MRGRIPPEAEKTFHDLGLDKLDAEIETILKREMQVLQSHDYYAADPNLILVRDLFVAGYAWRLLDGTNPSNAIAPASDTKLGAFLVLARYKTKAENIEFDRARASANTLLATSNEKGTIAAYVVNKTHDCAVINTGFLLELVKHVIEQGNLKIQPKKAGRLVVGLERLSRFIGWAFAGIGFLLGLALFNSNGDGFGEALVTAAVAGVGMYGLARGIGWVLKGFILENP